MNLRIWAGAESTHEHDIIFSAAAKSRTLLQIATFSPGLIPDWETRFSNIIICERGCTINTNVFFLFVRKCSSAFSISCRPVNYRVRRTVYSRDYRECWHIRLAFPPPMLFDSNVMLLKFIVRMIFKFGETNCDARILFTNAFHGRANKLWRTKWSYMRLCDISKMSLYLFHPISLTAHFFSRGCDLRTCDTFTAYHSVRHCKYFLLYCRIRIG